MRRVTILILAIPVYIIFMMLMATFAILLIADWGNFRPGQVVEVIADSMSAREWWVWVGGPSVVLVGLQSIFLVPVLARTPPRGERPRSLAVSLVVVGFIAAVLLAGLAGAAVEFVAIVTGAFEVGDVPWLFPVMAAMFLTSWAVWSCALLVFARGLWADRVLGRAVGLLLAGTVVETLVVLPIDIMVRRRTDCYCVAGSFFALGLSALAVLWLAGPGIVIALMSKRHRGWRETHCARCGYPTGPTPGPACPECGFGWGGRASPKTGRGSHPSKGD